MFRNLQIQKAIAAVVLVTFTSYTLYPMEVQAQAIRAQQKLGLAQGTQNAGSANTAQAASPDEQLGLLLNDLQNQLKALVPQTAYAANQQALVANMPAASGASRTLHLNGIKNDAAQIRALYAQIDQSFADTTQRLKAAKLPQEILDRQTAVVAQYASRRDAYESLMKNFEQATAQGNAAGQQSALSDLGAFMAKNPNAPLHQFGNPSKLPFGVNMTKVRAPNLTAAQYGATLFPQQAVKAQNARISAKTAVQTSGAGPGTPDSGDLAATDDIQITPAIQAQAKALGNNPVAIYDWVRNNVKFIPSYGSIQGSDATLQSMQGNDMDTASLLIALYRASGIPARYAYATVNIPASTVMNWVGVTTPEAALSLLSQGGVPSVGVTISGSIQVIQMEHVYVEVYVDKLTGGAKTGSSALTWFPVDASFKQYQYAPGMNINANVPFDSQNLITVMQQGATVDTTQGFVQNINQANLQAQLTQYQSQVQTYINSQNPNATINDVFGTTSIVSENYSMLFGNLPYEVAVVAGYFQSVPDSLKWKFKTNIYAADGVSDSSNPIIEINQSTTSLAGKKITLGFSPASPADQALVNSYYPAPHADGTPIQPSELPSSLPGYLLNLNAEFRVDGQIVQTSGGFTMGAAVMQSNQYFNPSTGAWDGGADNPIVAGEYDAIGMDLQGINRQLVASTQARVAATNQKIAAYVQNQSDTSPISGLTKEDITGDTLQSGILQYFARVDCDDLMLARAYGNIATFRLPSYGRFIASAQPHFFFGIVRSVTFPGVMMDVGFLRQHSEAKDFDPAKRKLFLQQAGADGSNVENSVPETMFQNPNLAANDPSQPQGISAVKAIALAAAQGQKIYTFNQSNQATQATILQGLSISEDVKSEISDALAAGMEVTVHEADITLNGWTGCGYIIADPTLGTGAYKVAGGANGGVLLFAGALLLISATLLLSLTLATAGVAALVVVAAIAIFIFSLLLSFSMIMASNGEAGANSVCMTAMKFFTAISASTVVRVSGPLGPVLQYMFSAARAFFANWAAPAYCERISSI